MSTVAIKDGHQGHPIPHGHHHNQSTSSSASTTTLDAERADRISRLAGLERVATVRGSPGGGHSQPASGNVSQQPGYFEGPNAQIKERSTVGSASATGSVGGRTTWASGSDVYDPDKMSEDQDEVSSTSGFSDEGNASLVGFGEGASSTISGPVSTAAARALAARPTSVSSAGRVNTIPGHMQSTSSTPMSGIASTPTPPGSSDPRMMDGVSYDSNVLDTTTQGPVPTGGQYGAESGGTDLAERIMTDRFGGDEGSRGLENPASRAGGIGKFSFEQK